jgi:hypothetical protein
VGGYYYADEFVGQAPFRPLVVKLDSAGNIARSMYYMVDSAMFGFDEYEFMQIEKTPGGGYYLVGNNYGNEHALFKMNWNYSIEWIREKLSGRASAMCAGYNEDVFISPEGNFANFVMQFDSAGQVVTNHITKNPVSGPDISFGKLTAVFRQNCGFLFINNEELIGHAGKDFMYCLDSSETNYINYHPVNNHYRRNASLQQGEINSLNEYTMTDEYSLMNNVATSLCYSEYSCEVPNMFSRVYNSNFEVYPNPASSSIVIKYPDDYRNIVLQIFDLSGNILLEKVVSQNQETVISELASGLYILKIISEKGVDTTKLIVD